MPIPDTEKLKLELKNWLDSIDRQFDGKDTSAVAAGRKLLEAVHAFERLTRRSKGLGAVIPVDGLNRKP